MDRINEMLKARVEAIAKGSEIGRVTEDEDVREWLVFGFIAKIFTIWAAMISVLLMVISLRF